MPASGGVGTSATDFFCGAVAAGSEVLRQVKAHPGISIAVIGGLAVLLLWGFSRTRWDPSTPLRVARRRAWGQMITAAWRMFWGHPRVFLGIGLLFVPIGIIIALLQWLLFHVTSLEALVREAGERNAFVATIAFSVGLVFTLLGFAIVQAATARAMVEIDAGRPMTALTAFRSVIPDVTRAAGRPGDRRGRRDRAQRHPGPDPGGRLPDRALVAARDRGGRRARPPARRAAAQRRSWRAATGGGWRASCSSRCSPCSSGRSSGCWC